MKANSGKCDFICSTNNKVNVIIENLKKQKKTTVHAKSCHCVKSVQMRSYFWSYFPVFGLTTEIYCPNAGKYGPEITPYLDAFHAVLPC